MEVTLNSDLLPTLVGDRVRLRLPVPADAEARLEVPRDPEENRMYGGDGDPRVFTREEVEAGLDQYRHQDPEAGRRFLIAARMWPDGRPIPEPDGRYIGTTRLTFFSRPHGHARFVIGIFDRRFWSHGYGTEAIRLISPLWLRERRPAPSRSGRSGIQSPSDSELREVRLRP